MKSAEVQQLNGILQSRTASRNAPKLTARSQALHGKHHTDFITHT